MEYFILPNFYSIRPTDCSTGKLDFSQERGFSDTPFTLTITPEDPSATIRYTLDGEEPSTTSGTIYNGSISVNTTTVLRAIGYIIGVDTSKVYTHSYIFIDDVINQEKNIAGWPNNNYDIGSGNATARHDYEMDPAIVNSAAYNADLIQGLKDIPSMSIVMPFDDFWDVNDGQVERKTSIELLYHDDPTENEQEDGGIEPHSHNRLKRSFRLSFKEIYGAKDWDSDIFRNSAVGAETAENEFDRIVLRAGNNRAWSRNWNTNRTAFTRDEWMRQSQIASSGIGSHGTFVHLYINGLYWGLYNPVERPDESFTSTYLGGSKADWFAVSHGGDQGGNDNRYDYIRNNLLNSNLSTNSAKYEELKDYLDIDKFSDYIILSWMTGVQDWPGNNWWGGNRNNPAGKFMFFGWDNEWSWDVTKNANNGAWVHPDFRSNDTGGQNSALFFNRAKVNDDFMMSFADRVYKLCYNDGAMTDANSRERWSDLNDNIENAVVAESARWGDGIDDGVTRTRDVHWQNEVNRLDGLMDGNVQRLKNALLNEDYYPTIDPPLFLNNGNTLEVQEILVPTNYNLDFDNPNGVGDIYYSINGIDPRLPGGSISSSAILDSNQGITINTSTTLLARVKNGNEWSALHCLNILVEQDLSWIKLTEIMYNPGDFGLVPNSELEFLEIKNTSSTLSLDVGGLQIIDGVEYTFPVGTIMEPKSFLILASNAAELANKCPGINIFGEYEGQLSNGGEEIEFATFGGEIIIDVEYDDIAPWPTQADGDGFSLVPTLIDPVGSQDDFALWTLSSDNFCGSPEADECSGNQAGQSCNDGDECTVNDVFDTACNCTGTYSGDSDGDGVCNTIDSCPNLDNNLIGTPCDDGNECTENDIYTADCECVGASADSSGSLSISPSDDAYLQGSSAFNSGVLRVENGNRISYLKFDLSAIQSALTNVELSLTVDNDGGNGLIEVFLGDSNNWTESTLSSANAPNATVSLASLNQIYSTNQTYTWNLDASQLSLGVNSLVIVHQSGNDVSFKSKENSVIPVLDIEFAGTGIEEGAACDDGDADTYDDVYSSQCVCEGTDYSTLGNYVWFDTNGDGIQDPAESGEASILIELYDDQDQLIDSDISSSQGFYSFGEIESGDYYIKVNLGLSALSFTQYGSGSDLNLDSDIDESNGPGTSPIFNLTEEADLGIDVGLILGVVPVKWLDFGGKVFEDFNHLEWSTANEINASHYEVQRSINNTNNFIKIDEVSASEKPGEINRYEYHDHQIHEKGQYFYRIKQFDNNGIFDHSKIINLNVGKNTEDDISFYPNPATEFLNVRVDNPAASNMHISLWNVDGRLVRDFSIDLDTGLESIVEPISIENLPSGIYNVKLTIANDVYYKKLLIID